MKIKKLLAQALLQLENISDSPRLDGELLLCHVLNKSKIFLYTDPNYRLSTAEISIFQNLLQQRLQGKPIAYIVGKQAFWTFELKVTPDVLIPRPETEFVIEAILRLLPSDQVCQVVDLGTGSGAIAIALALERPLWQITAVDISEAALAVAKENAIILGVKTIRFLHGSWFEPLEKKTYDGIVANPPYIAENDAELVENVRKFEPKIALISGKTGLECIETIAKTAKIYLKSVGYLVFEHGYRQAEAIQQLLEKEGYQQIISTRDYSNLTRVITAQTHFS